MRRSRCFELPAEYGSVPERVVHPFTNRWRLPQGMYVKFCGVPMTTGHEPKLSETSLNREGRSDQDQRIRDTPRQRNPGRHAEVASHIDGTQPTVISKRQRRSPRTPLIEHSQSAHHIARNKRLDRSNNHIQRQYNTTNQLPVSPLYSQSIQRCHEMHASHADQSPVEGEAPHWLGVVEVDELRAIDGKGPVERGKGWLGGREGFRVDYVGEEAVAVE